MQLPNDPSACRGCGACRCAALPAPESTCTPGTVTVTISTFGAVERPHDMYGKQTERAIAAMSRLAEVWDGGETRLSAFDIADERKLPRAMVAKLLSALSQAGLVRGSPGPGGGYALAKPPDQISLQDVFELFEREDTSPDCPFGGGICGVGDPCALHDKLVAMQSSIKLWLRETTFESFRVAAQERGLKPATMETPPKEARQSYRAPKHRGV